MKQVPVLLKSTPKFIDPKIPTLIERAITYLQAYRDTADWGYIPTAIDALDQINDIHFDNARRLLDGKNSQA